MRARSFFAFTVFAGFAAAFVCGACSGSNDNPGSSADAGTDVDAGKPRPDAAAFGCPIPKAPAACSATATTATGTFGGMPFDGTDMMARATDDGMTLGVTMRLESTSAPTLSGQLTFTTNACALSAGVYQVVRGDMVPAIGTYATAYFFRDSTTQAGESGTITLCTLVRSTTSASMTGTYDIALQNGDHMTGSFDAEPLQPPPPYDAGLLNDGGLLIDAHFDDGASSDATTD